MTRYTVSQILCETQRKTAAEIVEKNDDEVRAPLVSGLRCSKECQAPHRKGSAGRHTLDRLAIVMERVVAVCRGFLHLVTLDLRPDLALGRAL